MPGTAVIEMLDPIPPGLPRLEFQALVQARIEAASNTLLAEGRAELAAQGLPVSVEPDAGAKTV